MTEPHREPAKKVRVGRVLILYGIVGVLLGCLWAMIQRMTGLPAAVGAGLTGGGIVAVAPVLNWLVRSGRAPWLLKE